MGILGRKEVEYVFEGWFRFSIPESWKYDVEDELLSVASSKNPKGVIQISYFSRKDRGESLDNLAKTHLKRFLKQYEIKADEKKARLIEGKDHVIANISGMDEDTFIEAWSIVNKEKLLLVTYCSRQKTRELEIAEKIVYSINLNV